MRFDFPRLVTHPNQNAFAILSPSEQVAETLLCTKQDNRDSIAKAPQPELGYGKYYVTAFWMKVRDGEAAALYILWAQEGRARKIVSWQLNAPLICKIADRATGTTRYFLCRLVFLNIILLRQAIVPVWSSFLGD